MQTIIPKRHLMVYKLRLEGKSWREIGEELGIAYQRAQQLYRATIEIRKAERYFNAYAPRVITTAYKCGYDFVRILKLYRLLKKEGILYTWKEMSDEELLSIKNFGGVNLSLLRF